MIDPDIYKMAAASWYPDIVSELNGEVSWEKTGKDQNSLEVGKKELNGGFLDKLQVDMVKYDNW